MPRFDFPVVFNELVRNGPVTEAPSNVVFLQEAPGIASTSSSQHTVAPLATPSTPSTSVLNDSQLWGIIDPDVARENPVEDKHRRLVRSHRSGPYDRELKPNAQDRDNIGVCYSKHL